MTDDLSRQSESSRLPVPDWDALGRFLAGESPADEATRVQQWLDAHPGDRALIEGLDTRIARDGADPSDVDVEGALRRVHARMDSPVRRLAIVRGSASPRRGLIIGMTLLAAAAVVVAVVTLRRPPVSAPSAATAGPRVFATDVGRRDSVTLSDGSRIVLGPMSRLTVAADYGVSRRSVELEGDGYFEVRHDAARPFSVAVGRALIEDLGTAFAVESDVNDTTAVAVISGSVRLRARDSSAMAGAVLAAGDRGALTADGRVRTYPHMAKGDDTAWTAGRLAFHDAPLGRIAAEIHRWYGIQLYIPDGALRRFPVTTTINSSDPIDQVLRQLALTLDARVTRQGDSATIQTKHGVAPER